MYCSKCGKEVREGAAFCPHCGAPINGPEPEEYEYEDYDEAAAVKKGLSNGVIIAIIAAAALVLLAGILAFTSLTHSKQQAQIAQMEAQVAQAEAEAEKAKQEAAKAQAEQKAQQEQQIQEQQAQEQAQAAAQASQPQTVNNYYYYGTGYASGTYYRSVSSGGYLWPTDSKYISRSDLSKYDQDTVAAIRNEIYARHGYAFQNQRWRNYFESKSWYVRDSSCTQSVALSRMNKIERANVDTIVQYEKDMGWK